MGGYQLPLLNLINPTFAINNQKMVLKEFHQLLLRRLYLLTKWSTNKEDDTFKIKTKCKLDPVGSTVRYEMMKLCTGSV